MQYSDSIHSCQGRILLAEDDLIGQVVTVRVLEKAGYKVDVVETGQAVVEGLEAASYDLVLMDCSMPVMDGFTATRAIRNSTSGKFDSTIPVVALTALTHADDRQRCVQAGMDDFLSKPVDSAMLLAVVGRCLGQEAPAEFPRQRNGEQEPMQWDPDFMDKLIDKFLAQVPPMVKSLQRALAHEDIAALQRLAHRLRGTADLFQAATVSRRARLLDQAGSAGDARLAIQSAKELIRELQNLTATLPAD